MAGPPIRNLNAQVVKTRLRRAGYRQVDIAQEVGVSASLVCNTISRRRPPSPASERVWQAIERAVGERRSEEAAS